MGKYLAIFTDNHKEEFDVHGFKIMSDRDIDRFEELAMSITWEFTYYANTEALTYMSGEDFLTRIEYKELTKNEYDTLEKIFGGEFGTFITEEYLESIIEDEEGTDNIDDEWENEDDY